MMTNRISRGLSLSRKLVPTVLVLGLCTCEGGQDGGNTRLDDLPTLTASETTRIGDFDDPDVGFSRISGVDLDREGNIYVLEGSVPEIRVYSGAGQLLRRIGQRGSGPGEFEAAPLFGVAGDTVWAIDNRRNRITLFDRTGTVLSTGSAEQVTVLLPSGIGSVLPRMMRADGKFISHMSRVSSNRRNPPSGVKPTDSIPVPFVLFDATGAVTDTIGWAGRPPPRMWRPPSEYSSNPRTIQVGGEEVWVPDPPSTLPWWSPLPDGYILIETPQPEDPEDGVLMVTRIGVQADTVFHRILHYRPEPYSPTELDSIASMAARGESGGMLPVFIPGAPVPDNWRAIARVLRSEMDFPGFKTPIQYPWVATDGSIWLRGHEFGGAAAHWILLDTSGRPRGSLELPSDIRILWSEGNTFWASDPDEYDVPWLVEFKIEGLE